METAMRFFLLVFSVTLLNGLSPAPACSQDKIDDSTRAKITDLLNRSTLLEPTMSVVREARFVRDSRAVLQALPGGDSVAAKVTNATDATRELERALAGSAVRANITSVPTGLVVHYRRLVDPHAPLLSLTTNDIKSLDPALYVFTCTDPKTKRIRELKTSCATNCNVTFNFSSPQ